MTNTPIAPASRPSTAGIDAKIAETRAMPKYIPATPPDTSRNGMRTPRSVRHRGLR